MVELTCHEYVAEVDDEKCGSWNNVTLTLFLCNLCMVWAWFLVCSHGNPTTPLTCSSLSLSLGWTWLYSCFLRRCTFLQTHKLWSVLPFHVHLASAELNFTLISLLFFCGPRTNLFIVSFVLRTQFSYFKCTKKSSSIEKEQNHIKAIVKIGFNL